MKGTGALTKQMVVVGSFMPMVMSMTENGKTTKLTASVATTTQTVPNTKATGSKTSSTDRGRRYGRMAHTTKDVITMGRNMARVSLTGQMEAHTRENSSTTIFMDMECTHGRMAVNTQENGT